MEWFLRPQEDRYVYGSKEIPDYKAPDLFSIKLYHGGDFDEYMSKYTGGKVDFVDCCDVDKLSMLELRDMLNQCVDDKSCAADFFYKNPEDSIEKGLMPLECDADVITMVQMVPATHMIEVFVLLTRPLAVDNLTISSAPTPPELVDLDEPQFDSDEAILEERNLVNSILDGEGVHKTFSEEEAEKVQDKQRKGRKRKGKKDAGASKSSKNISAKENRKSTVVEDDAFPDVEVGSWHDDTSNKDMSDNDAEFEAFIHSTNFEEFIKQRKTQADVGNEPVREAGGSSENAGGNGNEVNMGNSRGETDGNAIEENMDPTGNEQNESEAEFEGFPDSDYAASDEERMAKSSDDEADCVYPEFNEKMDMKNPKFELVVNLNNKSCACQKWQLSGVPCFHAAASYRYKGFDPQDGIHESYSIEKFRETYNHFVEPINGEHFWERTPYPRPLPPDVKVAPGRPKKKRSRKNDITEDGVELKRQNTSLSCGYCREFGHNRKTCPAKKNDEAQGGAQTATTEVSGVDVLGGADQHTTQTRASQPQTQSSQTTEAAAVKKRRGRPKKQPPCAPLTKEQRKQLLTPSSP